MRSVSLRENEQAARLRGAKERSAPGFQVSSRVTVVRLLFTISPKWRACLLASAVQDSCRSELETLAQEYLLKAI